MAATLESSSTKAWTNAASIAVDKPTGLAVGDRMVAVIGTSSATDPAAPEGWTTSGIESGGDFKIGAFWKTADAGDVAGSTFTFTGSAYLAGAIYRISGSSISAPVYDGGFSGGLTPTWGGNVLIMGVAAKGELAPPTFSDYAITTSNPDTWTEIFDAGTGVTNETMGIASAPRTESTATGAFSVTKSQTGDVIGFLVCVSGTNATTVTAVPGALTLAGGTTVIKFGVKILASVGSLILAGGTQVIRRAISWANSDKSSTTFTNQDKNSTSWTNKDKSSTNWTNQNKT